MSCKEGHPAGTVCGFEKTGGKPKRTLIGSDRVPWPNEDLIRPDNNRPRDRGIISSLLRSPLLSALLCGFASHSPLSSGSTLRLRQPHPPATFSSDEHAHSARVSTFHSSGRYLLWLRRAREGFEVTAREVNMATLRNLKIKTATCRRILKELHSYEKEVQKEAAKTADMKEKGADPHDLKQQENVLAESRMMVPDCYKRLEAALAELKGTLAEMKESNLQCVEIEEADSVITEVEASFPTSED
ncbi:uncharacterized protein LOC103720351 [Phoenix dactylifera]|uniref:Tubulin-specific chaperone A n=1 Tax=Phoenix dactylifera TaxID=42345 RepID=A0A8B7CWU4_PHODC|nr:uncharacterized protein LOC103720351 [Phoenix dactylifera]